MLSPSNTIKARTLARYMTDNESKREAIVDRLQKLNDNSFNYLYTNVNSQRFYLGEVDTIGYLYPRPGIQIVKIRVRYQDILTGEVGDNREHLVSGPIMEQGDWGAMISSISAGTWTFRGKEGTYFLWSISGYGGYNILPQSEPIIITPGSGATNTTVIPTANGSTITQTETTKAGFDLGSIFAGIDPKILYIGGGVIALAVVGKKMKWF